jgi:hypothetical protein
VSHGGSIPVAIAIPHGVKFLPLWGTTAGEHLRRQGRAAQRQDPAAQRHGGRSQGHFYFFKKSFLKHF